MLIERPRIDYSSGAVRGETAGKVFAGPEAEGNSRDGPRRYAENHQRGRGGQSVVSEVCDYHALLQKSLAGFARRGS